jgi:HEAT repeat protein
MLQAAKSGADRVRIAAIGVLSRLGDASSVPTLLEIATEENPEVAQAAKAALESLPGDEVDADLAARLQQATGDQRTVLIELVGLRRIDALPALIDAVEDADPNVRAAALTALGATVDLEHLSVLLSRVVDPQYAADSQVASRALRAACVRMPDREACAAQLADAMNGAPLDARRTVLEVLSAMGGPAALKTVGAAAKTGDPQLQDTASRLLGEWMTTDAGPVLLELAAQQGPYQVRALRGYIRIVRQFDLPDAERVAMCRRALEAAERNDEKKLVLEVLQRYPSVDMLKLAVQVAEDSALKSEATAAVMAIAQEIGGTNDVRQLLEQIGQEPVRVEIVSAQYGAEGKFKDVTDTLQRYTRDLPLIVLPSTSYNSAFGGDPAPGVVKQLKIQYRINGKPGEISLTENAAILLPMPK